jgi:hypothetical protein
MVGGYPVCQLSDVVEWAQVGEHGLGGSRAWGIWFTTAA